MFRKTPTPSNYSATNAPIQREFIPPPYLLPTSTNPCPIFTPTTAPARETGRKTRFGKWWHKLKKCENVLLLLTIAFLYLFPASQPFIKPSVDYGITAISQLLNGEFPL